jgi:OmpA-OmpF porin, OOP family
MRAFLIAFLILLWLILGWLFYHDHSVCCNGAKDVSGASVISPKTGPLLFAHNSASPIIGNGWPDLRDSLALSASDTTSLEIVGWYCANLSFPENEELAKSRANEIRKLFSNIPDDRIIINTKKVECDSLRPNYPEVAASFASRVRTKNIIEVENRTIIYFPPNSTKKLDNEGVETYLKNVANRVLKSGETILLTGHTDNLGAEATNLALGQKRADILKQYLVEKGVPSDKIRTFSKGESNPIADNETEDGRSKNRRTELQIIK